MIPMPYSPLPPKLQQLLTPCHDATRSSIPKPTAQTHHRPPAHWQLMLCHQCWRKPSQRQCRFLSGSCSDQNISRPSQWMKGKNTPSMHGHSHSHAHAHTTHPNLLWAKSYETNSPTIGTIISLPTPTYKSPPLPPKIQQLLTPRHYATRSSIPKPTAQTNHRPPAHQTNSPRLW